MIAASFVAFPAGFQEPKLMEKPPGKVANHNHDVLLNKHVDLLNKHDHMMSHVMTAPLNEFSSPNYGHK